MRAWLPCGVSLLFACWGCAAIRAEPAPARIDPEPQPAAFQGCGERTRHSDLVALLGAQPTRSLPVGEDRALVVWSFERWFSELESPVVHVVALEDRDGMVDWWFQVPAPLAYICCTPGCPLCTPTRVLWPLVDGGQSAAEREQILRSEGLLER